MDEEKRWEVASNSLSRAHSCIEEGNYGRAFAHYLVVLELCPNQRADYEKDFICVLKEWTALLEKTRQLSLLYKCYEQVLHYFPSNIEILNSFGMQLLRFEQNATALQYFNMAYALDRQFLPSEKYLYIAKINVLPRWHFRMLNDKKRNISYYNALKLNSSRKFSRVVDIGAGSGLLSLFSSKCENVQSISAIEESPILSKIATNVFRENGVNNVILFNKSSTEFNGNTIGLHNLLVTEIFDTALFGEHVLETLIHAWENLLETSSKVIPYSAILYITGINSEEIYKKHRYIRNILSRDGLIVGLDDVCLTQAMKEPYEAENLGIRQVDFVTSTKPVITVNFNDVTQLKSIFSDEKSIPIVTLKSLKDSEIHAFAIWFDLHVDDCNIISTNPAKKDVICWEQAVIYRNHPYPIKKDEEMQIRLSCLNNKLELKEVASLDECNNCFKVSQDVILFLNDNNLMQTICSISEMISKNDYTILDLNPFPIFGILMAKRGCKAHCVVNKDSDLEFLDYLCNKNNLHDNLVILSEDAYNSLLGMSNVYDIIYIDGIYPNGTINDMCIEKFSSFRRLLKGNGILLPQNISLVMQIIDSNYVETCSKVCDENTYGFKIAEQMNEYAIPELWELDYHGLPHTKLSNSVILWNIFQHDEELHEQEFDMEIVKSGRANASLYWFSFNFGETGAYETNSSSYYKIASFIFSNPKCVQEGNVLKVKIKQHRGLLKVDCIS